MAEKVLLVTDPGIDGAFAIALALNDPEIEVLALAATAGNVNADLASRNTQLIVEQLDPPRWPRIGAALPVEYDRDATDIHGSDGLGGQNFPCARLHHTLAADKLILDTLRQHPGEVTIVLLGPATVLARALDRDPDAVRLLNRLVIVGGTWHEAGDAGPVSEFHFWCDPQATRQVLRSGIPITLLPLDVTRKLLLSPGDIRTLGNEETRTGTFLRTLVPLLLAPTAGHYGVEGAIISDAVGIVALARPELLTIKALPVDIETRGELTRGMCVVDTRWATGGRPNVDLVTGIDVLAAREHVQTILRQAVA